MINIRTKIADWLEAASTTTTDATAVHESINELATREEIDTSSITSYQEILEALSNNAIKVITDIADSRGLNESLAKKLLKRTSVNEMAFQVAPNYTLQFDTQSNLDKALKAIGTRVPYTVDGLLVHLEKRSYLDVFKGTLGCGIVVNESLAGKVLGETDISEEDGKWYVYCSQGKEIYAGPFESEEEGKSKLFISPSAILGFGNLDSDGNFDTTQEECKMKESLSKQLLNKSVTVNESVKTTNKKDGSKFVTDAVSGSNSATFIHGGADSLDDVKNWLDEGLVSSLEEFIGLCLHTIQQIGGELYVNDKQVEASSHSQTDGKPVKLDSLKFVKECNMKESLAKQLLNKTSNINEASKKMWYLATKSNAQIAGPFKTSKEAEDELERYVTGDFKYKDLSKDLKIINENKTVDMLSDWQKQVSAKHKGAEFITVDQLSEKNGGQDIVAVIGVYSQKTESGRFYESYNISVTNVGDAKAALRSNNIDVLKSSYTNKPTEEGIIVCDNKSAEDTLRGLGLVLSNTNQKVDTKKPIGKELDINDKLLSKLKEGDKVYGYYNGATGAKGKPHWTVITEKLYPTGSEYLIEGSRSSINIACEDTDYKSYMTLIISKYIPS